MLLLLQAEVKCASPGFESASVLTSFAIFRRLREIIVLQNNISWGVLHISSRVLLRVCGFYNLFFDANVFFECRYIKFCDYGFESPN